MGKWHREGKLTIKKAQDDGMVSAGPTLPALHYLMHMLPIHKTYASKTTYRATSNQFTLLYF